jgi:hypothetical protein
VPPERQRYAQGKRKAREYRIKIGANAADVRRTIQADVKFLMVNLERVDRGVSSEARQAVRITILQKMF